MYQIFAINIPIRKERKDHIEEQFADKQNMGFKVVSCVPHKVGAISLCHTIQHIIKNEIDWENDFFILCEDDHLFTKEYSIEYLASAIQQAQELNAEILSGGVSWFKTGIQISKDLFCLESFTGLQFTVIYKNMYQRILDIDDFTERDAADLKISSIAERKFVMYPFISIQKEFGYSDVTEKNKEDGRVERLFKETSDRLKLLRDVRNFYLSEL